MYIHTHLETLADFVSNTCDVAAPFTSEEKGIMVGIDYIYVLIPVRFRLRTETTRFFF